MVIQPSVDSNPNLDGTGVARKLKRFLDREELRQNPHKKKVVIVQSTARHYRVKFFSALHERLAQGGIDLRVVYSDPNAQEAKRRDCVELDTEVGVKVRADWLLSDRLVYQHAWRQLADAHLVIVEHASKHLLNYGLFARRAMSPRKIALWGHGFSPHGTRPGKFLRDCMLRLTDWYFAYNDMALRHLIVSGVPAGITTNVQNAIDTDGLSRAVDRISSGQAAALRCALQIGPDARVGLFCGSLYSSKRLPTLIASSALVRTYAPDLDFHLVIVGDGPDRRIVKDATSRYSWVHYAGPRFSDDRAPYFRIADLVVNPGLIGLGILDAFAVGLPVLTTDIPIHSPEFEYLEDGRNGIVTRDDTAAYADAIVGILANHNLLGRLREGACISGRKYTLGNMVGNFAGGVRVCLECERSPVRAWSSSLRSRAPNS